MAIDRTFTIPAGADALKSFFEKQAQERMDLKMFFGEMAWEGNTMNFKSGLGEGSIALSDNEAKIHIELSMFGNAMSGQIEGALEKFPEMFTKSQQ